MILETPDAVGESRTPRRHGFPTNRGRRSPRAPRPTALTAAYSDWRKLVCRTVTTKKIVEVLVQGEHGPETKTQCHDVRRLRRVHAGPSFKAYMRSVAGLVKRDGKWVAP